MSIFTKTPAAVAGGFDASGTARAVSNAEMVTLLAEMAYLLETAALNGLIFSAKATMDADLAHGAGSMAIVAGDSAANDGLYRKEGASGAGSWIKVISGVPGYAFAVATDAASGDENAIAATTELPVTGSQLITLQVTTTNTATPVTVAFNGGAALTIKTQAGNNVAIGGLVGGTELVGRISGSTFRLLSDQASAAIQAAAEAALSSFYDWFIGAAAADPTTDLNGDPVTAGQWYWNTATGGARIYNGAAWVAIGPLASQAQAEALASSAVAMTPLGVAQAMLAGNLADIRVTGGYGTTVASPVGNPSYNVKTSAFFDVNTTTDASPEFGLLVDMVSTHGDSTAGSGAHKAAIFGGMEVGAGSSDGWAGVFVTQLASGAPAARGAIGVEIDLNNEKENINNTTGRYAANLYVTGAGTYKVTAALWVNASTAQWYRGLYFGGAAGGCISDATIQDDTNATTSYLVQGSHTNGIDLSNGSFSGSAFKSTGFSVSGAGAVSAASMTVTGSGDIGSHIVSTGTVQSAYLRIVGKQGTIDSEFNIVSAGSGLGAAALRITSGAWTVPAALSVYADSGITIGAPTGGSKGAGTLNTAGDIYKNDSAYTNPDYVFEHHYAGEIVKFAARDGAKDYAGILPLKDLRAFTRDHLRLPGMPDDPLGVFGRADKALEKIEEAHLYIMELEERLALLEAA